MVEILRLCLPSIYHGYKRLRRADSVQMDGNQNGGSESVSAPCAINMAYDVVRVSKEDILTGCPDSGL